MLDWLWQAMARLEETPLSTWVREENFIAEPFSAFYVMLAFHAIGMVAVVGISFMLSVRLFGFLRSFPIEQGRRLMWLAWAGFYVNLISGTLLLLAQPRREFLTATFNIKIVMVILACITMAMMQRAMAQTEVLSGGGGTSIEIVPERAKLLALATNLLWLGAIIAGRVIGYLQPPPP